MSLFAARLQPGVWRHTSWS